MNTLLIKLFNAAISEESNTSFASVNAEAIQRGYVVEPEACTDSVLKFLQEQDINPNATFYKTWEDITNKTRFELFIDQLYHYITTYGTNFSCLNGYVPNDGCINIQTTFEKYKVIKLISEKELETRCYDILASGIALKEDTMKACADYVIESKGNNIDVDSIKNREAVVYICNKLNIVPKNKFNLLRYIIYVTTGSTLIIKNDDMIRSIVYSKNPFDFSKLNADAMKSLASIFFRYKKLFLAFKHCSLKTNSAYINKLRKMAKEYHEPMKENFWQTIFNKQYTIKDFNEHIDEITNFKKVALMQSCLERVKNFSDQLYIVRNQKIFLRKDYSPKTNKEYIAQIYAFLYASLMETLRKNATYEEDYVDDDTAEVFTREVKRKVRFAKGISVALPTSEKSFIGNYPFGTTYDMSNDNYFGIYWKNEWGTLDYDLSFLDFSGRKIGWNSNYYNDDKDIIYSGDMTNADPEAAEVIYMKKSDVNGIIAVNQYNGNEISKYKFFFGQSDQAKNDIKTNKSGYMVDPASIKLNIEVKHENVYEQKIAVISNNKIILMAVNTGNGIVSRGTYAEIIGNAIINKASCFVQAETLLREAGYEIVDDSYTGNVDIDFNNLDKDSLINIMK